MLENKFFLLLLSVVFAAIPVAIWLFLVVKKSKNDRKIIALVFLLGCLTAPILLSIQYLWDTFPNFNLERLITSSVQTQSLMYIFLFVLFGAMEEIIKMFVVKSVDDKTLLINTINDAIRYSLISALGFSFAENIYYLYHFWPSISLGELTGMYIFRSIFTTCAHLIFSGVFGYYYGIGKFSITITEQYDLMGESSGFVHYISKLFNLPLSEGFRQKMVLKGLFLAIGMHATFNYLLQFNILLPVMAFVVGGYFFLMHLLNRRAGHLILTVDPTEKTISSMKKRDEEVVVELIGIWFKEKRYVDVLHVCERLLERDPDNKVVQLFKARAIDEMDSNDVYRKIFNKLFNKNEQMEEARKNVLSEHLREKENFQKVRQMIKKQLEKRSEVAKVKP